MRYIKSILILLTVAMLTSCSQSPTTVYLNGKIYSLDNNNSQFEAMAVRDGKIVETGTSAEIKDKYKSDEAIDLGGKTVLPGFIDMEGSIVEFAKNLGFINFSNAKSIAEVQKIVEENAKKRNDGSWIVGYALNELNFSEDELLAIDKSVLDKAAPNHHVYIVNITGDMVWANSKLLQFLQITNLTPNPKDGEIEKNEKGEITGLLFDAAVNIVKEKSPEISKDDLSNLLQTASKEVTRYGITEIHDRTINSGSIDIFRQLIDSNKFYVKIYGVLSVGDETFEEYLKRGILVDYKDMLTVRSVSIDYDGALNLQAASMKDSYKKEIRSTFQYATDEEVESNFRKAIEKEFQFCIKSVGDKAVHNNLNIIEKVLNEKKPKDARTILEYTEFVQPSDISRFGTLGVIPSIRPEVTIDNLVTIGEYLPESNGNNLGMWNSLLQSSKYITAGTNFPYSAYISPIALIHLLVNRQPLDTTINSIPNMNQKLSILEAVKAFTVYAAYAGFEEKTKGTLQKGKYADFVVLSDDIFTYDPKKIKDIQVLKTVINGKTVFSK
ncbi:MAG: amidohydrolase [Candidatus Kapaibacterium sp.]